MKRKLIMAIGPLVVAVVMLLGVLFAPFNILPVGKRQVADSATAISTNIMKGEKVYQTAMNEPQMVPFFGSSELSRFDPFHPSVLAEKYQRNYTPYLIGNAGSQSLTHFLAMEGMGESLKNKKAVFIISPQWFVKKGAPGMMFDSHFSPLQTFEFIKANDKDTPERRYAASRLLTYKSVKSDIKMVSALRSVEKGEALTRKQRVYIKMKLRILEREDDLFGAFITNKNKQKVEKSVKRLPDVYNFENLDKLAYQIGEKGSNNNPFEIKNGFYQTRIQPIQGDLKNSQTHFDYECSPEYSDFQLVLAKMKENNMDVRFVVTPVNHKWMEFTGLSPEMMEQFSKKINYQLKSQGFKVVDFSQDGSESYFMQDTIHIGWRGWLALDKQLKPFLESKTKESNVIKLNNYFLTKEWQDKKAADMGE
ncbi:D-alanyl-lipoteichoic acid biosynthesis protein DltD [Carnobacterium divergens]|uniref:D-alanyl-lipoteichoic acid biosynthesis protein DltD n=1 Tax=Carnobacterium divergens TaxID=2748 RepID=UPI000E713F55|nr:D-alanyl-lipoteichoic acid biosynthesis protein DltD [Carnobacterium divergens]AOA00404.1 D-alanyl-lipoteichoic acid biosynthesis protein DltD [Carnobacterium divergens]MDT1995432.1 D-alanyl-lipoteichoic acid biosynthesis protein DltD [Carnobacterium divergens]TFI62166.1 D-alanyl-lipoteichoic acid biosynthesis protein DltD [Carnobacterium divergens]TFI62264.1 D-alanyl-lipoteichoic acid biosynthesis protein DltD [Carnobacterium divergens]TFI66305.1 D-alanyl-lipoteichoic acid biosynthesis pro